MLHGHSLLPALELESWYIEYLPKKAHSYILLSSLLFYVLVTKMNFAKKSSRISLSYNNEIQSTSLQTKIVQSTEKRRWRQAAINIARTGHFLNIVPIEFDSTTELIKPSKFPRREVWWLIFFFYAADTIYLLSASFRVTLTKVPVKEFMDFYMHFVTRLIAGIIQLVMGLSIKEFTQMYNIQIFIRRQKKNNFGWEYLDCKIGTYLLVLALFAHIQPIFPLILHLTSRHSVRYWGSQFLRGAVYNSLSGVVIFALLDLIYSLMAIFGTLFAAGTVVAYIVYAETVMTVLR